MSNTTRKTTIIRVCFQNFDHISSKLILTRLNDPVISIDLVQEPTEADVVLYNQEHENEQGDIKALMVDLEMLDVPMLLLTETPNQQPGDNLKIIDKTLQKQRLSQFLYLVKDTFYEVAQAKLKRKESQNGSKLIYNRHLSNAINPGQIKFESNRYYAQKYVGLNPDIDFADLQALEQVQIDPENYLFHYLRAAFETSVKKRKPAFLQTVYGDFFIDAAAKLIYHEKTAEEIVNIHKIPFYKNSKISIPKLKRGQLESLHAFDYEPFVWRSSINASKGKIPNHINVNAPVKIIAWPDLTQLIVFKHAIRIIALWSRGVYSLKHTGRLLNIPQRYPLTVYTAMHALGLVTEVKKR